MRWLALLAVQASWNGFRGLKKSANVIWIYAFKYYKMLPNFFKHFHEFQHPTPQNHGIVETVAGKGFPVVVSFLFQSILFHLLLMPFLEFFVLFQGHALRTELVFRREKSRWLGIRVQQLFLISFERK